MNGKYKVKNTSKYLGDPTNIIYRSSYELKYMIYLDSSKEIIAWSSEEVRIPYVSPLDSRRHLYFPDFLVIKETNKKKETFLVEIKPRFQTIPPTKTTTKSKKPTKKYINAMGTYLVNEAKFSAGKKYAEKKGWEFQILTEYELGIKTEKK